ncbi:predicted protein [Streptomyces iranensis]|uniref:Uncharacterized protein n=1 Tax=Streptomyces iranensis TaxID=576784 RepID=A0A060ZRV1_9ACTN|nr:predicted protein [Streptomyces iranensis]
MTFVCGLMVASTVLRPGSQDSDTRCPQVSAIARMDL